MNRITIIIFCLFISILNCIGQNKISNEIVDKEIPTWKDGDKDLFYKLTKQKSEQLELNDLEIGYDSIQIRIWYDYSLINLRELVVLKYTNQKWWGIYYKMDVEWNASNLTETIEKFEKRFIFPENGWENLISKLSDKKITELPNMREIDGLKDYWTDGITYNVEIGTKNKYRFFSYHLPNEFLNFWQAQNMVDILELIRSEFKVTKKL